MAGLGPAITIFTDAQAALQRIKHDDQGPGQRLAQRVHVLETVLQSQGTSVEFRWVPGHKGIPGNEEADRAAGQAAREVAGDRLSPALTEAASLAHLKRRITEEKWKDSRKWIALKASGRRAYKAPGRRQTTDPTPACARKSLAGRFYQLKIGHALIGPYILRFKIRDSDRCWWCTPSGDGRRPVQTREHLFKHCRHWQTQQDTLWDEVREATGATDTLRKRRNTSINQLFADTRCSPAILKFLATTDIGRAPPGIPQPPPTDAGDPEVSDSETTDLALALGTSPEPEIPGWTSPPTAGRLQAAGAGGENEDGTGARAQAARDGAGGVEDAGAQAQAVIDLVLGRGALGSSGEF